MINRWKIYGDLYFPTKEMENIDKSKFSIKFFYIRKKFLDSRF